MVLLKDSSNQEDYRARYENSWRKLQDIDEAETLKILDFIDYRTLSRKQKIMYKLQPFKTHLLWIIPLSVITVVVLLYAIIVLTALLVE